MNKPNRPDEHNKPDDQNKPEGVTTRAELREQAPEQEQGEEVSLTAPNGTKVTVAADEAERLKKQGYK